MAFVSYNPGEAGYSGSLTSALVGYADPVTPDPYVIGIASEQVDIGSLGVTRSAIYNPQRVVINGWQTLQTGGGPTRPTSGMIYPRGTG